jgi:hypothetical protein
MRIPGFSQGEPAPAAWPRRQYGAGSTIHQTGTIDVQLDAGTGEVVAVWFRCLSLPFTVGTVEAGRQVIQPGIAIESVTYAEEASTGA